jgi:hypothetical protein
LPYIRTAPLLVEYAFHGIHTNGREITNIWHEELESAGGTDRPVAIAGVAAVIRDGWQDQILDRLSNNYTFTGISWVDLDTIDGTTGAIGPNGALPLTGASTTEAAEPQVSVLAHKRTISTRTQRAGRTYFSPIPDATADENGVFVAGQQASWNTTLTNYFNTTNALVGGFLAIAHVGHWQIPPGPPPPTPVEVPGTSTQMTAFEVDTMVATQRRRLRG